MTNKIELTIILGLLTAMGALSIDMYLPAFGVMENHFHTDTAHVQLTLTSFFIAFSIGQLIYGPLADRYGRKPFLLVGLGLYVLSSFASLFAPTVEVLMVLRFLQALGASAGVVIARAIISDLFVAKEAADMYSSMMLVIAVAPIMAPIFGAYLVQEWGWHSIFMSLTLIGGVIFLLSKYRLQETRQADLKNKLSLRSIASRYVSLTKNRHFIGYLLTGGMSFAGLFTYITGASFVYVSYFGISETEFAYLFGLNGIGFLFASQLNRFLLRYKTPSEILSYVLVFQVLIAFILISQSLFIDSLYALIVPLFLQISIIGIIAPNTTALAMAHYKAHAGSASAFLGSMQFLIAGLASAIVGVMHFASPFGMVLLIGVYAILGLVFFYFLCRK